MSSEDVLEKKEEQVMVSVLCATYNHEKYIARALEGFVSQITGFRFEVIVHEDVSTDGTRAIVEKYEKDYPDLIKPIYQKENQYSKGRGVVLSNMLFKAKGKYIALCEGDDYWIDAYKLQKQYEALEEHEECSICIHRVKTVLEDEKIVEKLKENKDRKYYLQGGCIEKEKIASAIWLEGGCPAHTSSFFIRKSVLEVRKENKETFLKCMWGDQINLRLCLMHGKFYRIDEFMSCRNRGVEGSWSTRWIASSAEVRAKYYKECIQGEMLFDQYSNYEFHEYIQCYLVNVMAECCIYEPESIKEFKNSISLSPKIIHDKGSLWLYIRYCILRVSPHFYKFLFGIQKKLLEKKQNR